MKTEIMTLANDNRNLLETLKMNQESFKIWVELTLKVNILK